MIDVIKTGFVIIKTKKIVSGWYKTT